MESPVTETLLPEVTPLSCQRQLSFTEFNRAITELIVRDRILEEAVLNFTNSEALQNSAAMLAAINIILGADLMATVISSGALPVGVSDFATFQALVTQQIAALQAATTITDPSNPNVPLSLQSVVSGLVATVNANNTAIAAFQAQLAAIVASTPALTAIQSTLTSYGTRLTSLEALTADMSQELTNARVEYASDPTKRLVDKIQAMDAAIAASQQQIAALTKEIVDARDASLYDTLAEHLGAISASVEALSEVVNTLGGNGTVQGLKVGRSILHGVPELIPGVGIAITRERNGFRIDQVDFGTVVDLSQQRIDPNNCAGPGAPSFGN